MKKGFIILLLGLIAGVGAFAGGYLLRSAAHRHMLSESKPELAWLKEEFKLTDAEFARIFNKKGEFIAVASLENGWVRPRLVLT